MPALAKARSADCAPGPGVLVLRKETNGYHLITEAHVHTFIFPQNHNVEVT